MKALMLIVLSLLVCDTPPLASEAADRGTRLVLLGTAGGPSAKKNRSQAANAVIVNGDIYIMDAGDGVVRQLSRAGFSVAKVRAVFITHHHSDHMVDYGTLLLRSWMTGRTEIIQTYGPTPLQQVTQDFLKYMRRDIELRISDEGRVPLVDLIRAHDIDQVGVIYADENVKVTVFEVTHGAAKPAYGYRFDSADKSIVFSGDTSPHENVVAAAKGADILVHEVVNVAAIDAMIERVSPGNDALRRHILDNHTSTDDVGDIATRAGVKMLVVSHFGGAGDPVFDKPEVWEAAVRQHYSGPLIIGEDLAIIE